MTTDDQKSMPASVAITVAMRWTDRLIGLLSTIVLARLLVPADFGIIAQAYLLIGLIDVLLDLGVGIALVQNRHSTPEHFNTAWTMRLAQAAIAATVAFLAAPIAAHYFAEPRSADVIRVLAVSILIAAMENIGIVTFQKEMRFGREFKFNFLKRISGVAVTMVLAFTWQSYWALVVGALSGKLIGVLLSYSMHPFRPRLSTTHLRELFSFSQWALLRGIGNYLIEEFHRLLVSGRSSTGTMGAYSIVHEISALPTNEVLGPLYRALFPRFVRAMDKPGEIKRVFLLAQGLQTTLVVPAGVGMALVAPELVAVMLGPKWASAVPFLQVLSLGQVINALMVGSGYVLLTMGQIRKSAAIAWSQVLSFAFAAIVLFPRADALEITWLRLASMLVGLTISTLVIRSVLADMRFIELGRNIWRPMVGALLMALTVLASDSLHIELATAALIFKVLLGAGFYIVSVAALWRWSGRPQGAETYLLELMRQILDRRRTL